MAIIMTMVRKDNFSSCFGSTWSRATNGNYDTSTERTCRSKEWHKRTKTKRKFLDPFQHPSSASSYGQKQLTITDGSQKTKHRVVPKLMKIEPKWNKWSNQRIIGKSFKETLDTKDWQQCRKLLNGTESRKSGQKRNLLSVINDKKKEKR